MKRNSEAWRSKIRRKPSVLTFCLFSWNPLNGSNYQEKKTVVAFTKTMEEVLEIESLEKSLLEDNDGNEEESVLYEASFKEMEENFVKYQTVQWVLYSLLLILAWGIGLLMLLYIPIRRFILRKDIRSRSLYLTPNAIVYKVIFSSLSNLWFIFYWKWYWSEFEKVLLQVIWIVVVGNLLRLW